jgi:hypothetical protein
MNDERGQERAARLARPVNGDPAHLGLGDPVVEAAVEVPRFDRRPVPRGEHKPGLLPAVSVPFTVAVLLRLPEP